MIRVAAFRIDDADAWESAQRIRVAVFVDEQRCPLDEEFDAYDAAALHWLASVDGAPSGTARLIDLGDGVAKIGRVAVAADARGLGVGRALMLAALDAAASRGFHTAILEAQTHAIPFYERLGFVAHGPEFDDCGIPHRTMTCRLDQRGGISS